MALKDWKRITNLTYFIKWKNDKNSLWLIATMDSIPQNGWIVYNWKLPKKRFKTKSQALKFAKNYMRIN